MAALCWFEWLRILPKPTRNPCAIGTKPEHCICSRFVHSVGKGLRILAYSKLYDPSETDRISYNPSNTWDISTPAGEAQFSKEMDALHQYVPEIEEPSKSLWIEVVYYGIMFVMFSLFFAYVF
ncbi:MAG: hypothetical protein WA957_00105 [Alteraurantiacibacter sp.]